MRMIGGSNDLLIAVAEGSYTLARGIDNGQAQTGSGAVNLTGNDIGNTLEGNESANTLNGDVGSDTLYGYDGNDILNGGNDSDALYGGKGDDNLNGDSGNDYMEGGEGNDTYHLGTPGDNFFEVDERDLAAPRTTSSSASTIRSWAVRASRCCRRRTPQAT